MASKALTRNSLKTRITLGTLSIFLLGLWSLSFYASQMLRSDMVHLLGEHQASTVSLVAAEVNNGLTQRLKGLQSVANTSHQAMQEGPAAMQTLLNQRPVLQTLFNGGVIAYDIKGAEIADFPMSDSRSDATYMEIDVVAAALIGGQSTIGRPVHSAKLKQPLFAMAAPIRDAQGKVIGALAGLINLGLPNFLDSITESRYGHHGYYLLEDPKGRLIITGTDKSQVMQALPPPGRNPQVDRHIQGMDETSIGLNPRGVEVLESSRRVPVAGWFMVGALPTAEAFAPIRAMQQRMLLATLFMTLLAGGLTWWLLRRQLAPILAAANALSSMTDNPLSLKPLPITRPDEVGELIGGFNRLLADLGQREAMLQRIFDTSSVAIFLVNLQGRITRANQRMALLFGCPLEALVGREYVSLIHPSEQDTGRQNMNKLLAGTLGAVDVNRLYCRADHSEFWGHLSSQPFFDVNGAEDGLIGVIADITQARQMEMVLRANEARYRAVTHSAHEAIVTTDSAGRIAHWNRGAEAIFGYTEAQALGMPVTELMPLSFRAHHLSGFGRWISGDTLHIGGKTSVVEGLRQDGRIFPMELSLASWQTDEGRFATGIMRDISERRQTEASLRVAATAFESQEAMTITDAHQVILKVNHAFTRITGYTEAEVIGQTPALLKSNRQDKTFYQDMWDSLARHQYWQGEIWNRRKSGEVYPERLAISAVLDEQGVVTNYVAAFSDITHDKHAQSEIQHLAFTDALTGLPNRRLLMDRLKHALATSVRNQHEGALLFIDLDNFKTLNDTLGHDIGDLLLQQVAQRLGTCVRESDTVARVGGDEFVVMLEELSANAAEAALQAETVGEKILSTFKQVYLLAGHEHHCSASIGITLFGNARETVDDMLKRADLAMYSSKTAGRNTLRFFDPHMQTVVTTRAALESDMREAVLQNQFLLYYQAQMKDDELTDERHITGAEVLIRWQHPQRGMVSPAEFIPVAEETGLILPIGQWVLETACVQLAAWAKHPHARHLTLAVNVSARQFHHPDFVSQVLAVLERTGANPQRLKLELTESMLVTHIDDIIAKMSALKTRGVSFSLDDFGTGYSSLSYLKRLPLDQLKIDQGFVRDILIDPNDAAIARTIVTLAQSLGLAVIAEGVETEDQKEALAQQGCHAYQGYLFSRPLPLTQFDEFMGKKHFAPPLIASNQPVVLAG